MSNHTSSAIAEVNTSAVRSASIPRATSATRRASQKRSVALPRISPWLVRWFVWYSRGYIRRHFHALRVSHDTYTPEALGVPIVLYSNHAAWWDPLVGLVTKEHFYPSRPLYAPIDAAMLQRYRMFGRMGFFGVEQETTRGAVQFLRTGETILRSGNSILAVTPQSQFADVRERPVRLRAGLGHLAARIEEALFVPVATEYIFWQERLPEILLRFGNSIRVNNRPGSRQTPQMWTDQFARELARAQDALATQARARDAGSFETILRGGAGQGGVYDLWRMLTARLRGKTFSREHEA